MAAPDCLYFTDDDEACRLLASDPFALLVGFALDQQVTVQTAFAGPLRLKQRLGTLDPKTIASTDPAKLEESFKEKPAIHRFPGSMAGRVHDLAATIADEYEGRAERVWTEAADADDLRQRLGALPGFGDMKVRTLGAVLEKRFGVPAARGMAPGHMTLGDVDSHESLAEYQAAKRAHKAALRAAKAS
ncbi:MAG: HhH-GPD family protein [Actinomycetia bacterium]|nr:HhH-GPD family protein [Actinomycetes bacterium]